MSAKRVERWREDELWELEIERERKKVEVPKSIKDAIEMDIK